MGGFARKVCRNRLKLRGKEKSKKKVVRIRQSFSQAIAIFRVRYLRIGSCWSLQCGLVSTSPRVPSSFCALNIMLDCLCGSDHYFLSPNNGEGLLEN